MSSQTEQFLLPEAQLDPSQGKLVYEWMCAQELSKRDTALKPTGRATMACYDTIRERADNIVREREENERKKAIKLEGWGWDIIMSLCCILAC